jgi:hypothetical protein
MLLFSAENARMRKSAQFSVRWCVSDQRQRVGAFWNLFERQWIGASAPGWHEF